MVLGECSTLMTDVSFGLTGSGLSPEHRFALAAAVEQRLPWLADTPGAGIHRLNLAGTDDSVALLSGRTRLTLRVPCDRSEDAARLQGSHLQVRDARLLIGAAQARRLRSYSTLYAHLVCIDHNDETVFLQAVKSELSDLGISCRPICGKFQSLESGALQGFSLMLDGLSLADSLRLQECGLGQHHRLGCGLFIPHKSAAAVGSAP